MSFETITFKRKKLSELGGALRQGVSSLLFGPLGTGKSTLLSQLSVPEANPPLRYDLQRPSIRSQIESDPTFIFRELESRKEKGPALLLVDEIQKIPAILEVLRWLIDEKLAVVVASASSARKIKTAGLHKLAGRVRFESLSPLTWAETGFHPSRLGELLRHGSLAGILAENDESARGRALADYPHQFLEEEIRREAAVRQVFRFEKFLRLAALESGSVPHFSKMGEEVGLSHTSIREYFQILEDSLLIHRLPAFGAKEDGVLKTSKYYFFDLGVRNAAAQVGHSEDLLKLDRERLFEHFIVLELIAELPSGARLSSWAPKRGEGVDLVIEQKDRLIAVDIRATQSPSPRDFKGLAAFAKKYSPQEAYLVCESPVVKKVEEFTALPWTELREKVL